LPEALAQVRKGQRVWFDDGRIGGIVRRCSARRVVVEITDAREGGEKLGADKGINLPDTELELSALTAQDLADLDAVAVHADIVGLSLNKGPHIVDAMRTLDDILRRMQSHQSKKRPLLRALKAWNLPPRIAHAS
jgi:pyruvate kinase